MTLCYFLFRVERFPLSQKESSVEFSSLDIWSRDYKTKNEGPVDENNLDD